MRLSKIGGNATYHKCINDLHACGYIQYIPSYHPALGSLVYIKPLDKFQVEKQEG